MRKFIGRLLGYEQQATLLRQTALREREKAKAVLEAATPIRRQRDDLTVLLEDQGERITAARTAIHQARRAIHLKNSGPAATRKKLQEALALLEGNQP